MGHDVEEIANAFEHAISGPNHVRVTISLLDPTRLALMESIAPVLGISATSLVERINDTIDSPRDVRENRLARTRRGNLQVWCHRVLPNASAIFLDGDHAGDGRVQLEPRASEQECRTVGDSRLAMELPSTTRFAIPTAALSQMDAKYCRARNGWT